MDARLDAAYKIATAQMRVHQLDIENCRTKKTPGVVFFDPIADSFGYAVRDRL